MSLNWPSRSWDRPASDVPWWDFLDDDLFLIPDPSLFRDVDISRRNRVDISETEDEYTIEMEVPGFQKPELDIEFGPDGRFVTISGKKEISFEEGEEKPRPTETKRGWGGWLTRRHRRMAVEKPSPSRSISAEVLSEFSRTFEFADKIRIDDADATLEHGVLTVLLPKEKPSIIKRLVIY